MGIMSPHPGKVRKDASAESACPAAYAFLKSCSGALVASVADGGRASHQIRPDLADYLQGLERLIELKLKDDGSLEFEGLQAIQEGAHL